MKLKRICVLLALGLASATAAIPAAAANVSGAPWLQPADGVFTCDWIAAHPAAASHWLVSCGDVSANAASTTDPTSASINGGVTPFTTGCQWIPSSTTYIGMGVYAWTSYVTAGNWDWTGSTNPAGGPYLYHWYLQKADGSNYAQHADTTVGSGSIGAPSASYRWGAQNEWNPAVHWQVCYS